MHSYFTIIGFVAALHMVFGEALPVTDAIDIINQDVKSSPAIVVIYSPYNKHKAINYLEKFFKEEINADNYRCITKRMKISWDIFSSEPEKIITGCVVKKIPSVIKEL